MKLVALMPAVLLAASADAQKSLGPATVWRTQAVCANGSITWPMPETTDVAQIRKTIFGTPSRPTGLLDDLLRDCRGIADPAARAAIVADKSKALRLTSLSASGATWSRFDVTIDAGHYVVIYATGE